MTGAAAETKFETVEYAVDGAVALIRMNRPEALNALSLQLARDLGEAVARTEQDGARAAILTGSGRAFCSGGDLREMRAIGEAEGRIEAFLDEPLLALHEVISGIRRSNIPYVAAVNGVCAGAGTNFALACDLVVASAEATFNEAFVRIGLSPDCGGTFFLPRAVGEKRAAELLMTGESLTGPQAMQLGLINRVVPAEDLMTASMEIARKLASGPSGAIGRIKRMLNESFANTLEEQMHLEHRCQLESGGSSDFKEGVAAFFEKRPPRFTGE